ncbi:MAG TPA: sensor histidine kinase, partial [Vicinamibacterales bacterium]
LVRRLFVNLLDNAIRYAPPQTTVTIELASSGDGWSIRVSDRGPGIPDDIQPHIFKRFYRGDSARRRGRPDGGAGLGLALARWIANVHGGDVTLERSSETGTVLAVSLPAAPPVS